MTSSPERSPMFPLKEFLGFTIESAEGRSVVELELDERHMNPNALAHGAVPFAMMDTAMGGAVMSMVDDGMACATIEIHTRFHRAAAAGRLIAEALILTPGRRVVHLEAKTRDSDGRLIASATGSFAIIELRPTSSPA